MQGLSATFVITSVIHFSEKKISAIATRSVFDPNERVNQTIKTVQSIREKWPGAFIVLLELGREKDLPSLLTGVVDRYVFVGDKKTVRWAVDGKKRGLGEAVGLIAANRQLKNDANFYFKISGRYYLNGHFTPNMWYGNELVVRKYQDNISTRMYGFGAGLFNEWQKALRRSLIKLYLGRSIEEVLPAKFNGNIREIKELGLSGFVSPNGSFLEE